MIPRVNYTDKEGRATVEVEMPDPAKLPPGHIVRVTATVGGSILGDLHYRWDDTRGAWVLA